jgi:hypothetical protein
VSYIPPEIRELRASSVAEKLHTVAKRHKVCSFPDDPYYKHTEEMLLELARLASGLLHMIDERRAAGSVFDPSYHEDQLRAAVGLPSVELPSVEPTQSQPQRAALEDALATARARGREACMIALTLPDVAADDSTRLNEIYKQLDVALPKALAPTLPTVVESELRLKVEQLINERDEARRYGSFMYGHYRELQAELKAAREAIAGGSEGA